MKQFFLMMLLILTVSSCSDDDDNVRTDPETTNDVRLATDSTLGSILTDSEGMTLYFFSNDTKNNSECSGGCVDTWPIFYVENPTLDTGLVASDFATITRPDGEMQTTYQGWPLYYFVNDETAGDTNGEAVNKIWYVAKPDYSLMYANAQLVGNDNKNYVIDSEGNYTVGDGATEYIVDIEGRTLYRFIPDRNNINNYTESDFSNNDIWPIVEVTLDQIPSILNDDDFGTIDVFGRTQLTYKGWPLYSFAQDTERGDNKGVSVPTPGFWPIANTDTETAPEADIRLVEDDTLGQILVDQAGNTLYFFSDDFTGTTSECEGGCLDAWPIFYAENPSLGTGLDADDFGTVMHPNGEMMTTYKDWPLYYFTNDTEPGDTNGEAAGEVWYVAKPDYTVMLVRAQLTGRNSDGIETDLVINDEGEYVEGMGETFYLVDAYGRTLYGFSMDTNNNNNFTNEDFSNNAVWPIFETELVNAPSILNEDDFNVIDVFGRQQLTYKGWPLYYFVQDMERGNNYGVGFPSSGAWPILNQNSSVLE